MLDGLIDIVILFLFVFVFGWVLYSVPPLVVGVLEVKRKNGFLKREKKASRLKVFPFFSLIVPMKDEEKVAARLLSVLMGLNYPSEKYEVIVVDDGSEDGTAEICREFESRYGGRIRFLKTKFSRGKAAALNYGLKYARGDVVGVFDADNVPDPNVLLNVAGYFADEKVVAVQGLLSSINAKENMVTEFIHYEQTVQQYVLLMGKDKLGLFVPLNGTCQFVRRHIIESLGGWSPEFLSEDMELSAKLTEKGHYVKFAADVRCWHETPSSLRQLVSQRVRWFRGCMEVAVKYGRLLKCLNRRSFDAETYFVGSFLTVAALGIYLLGFYNVIIPLKISDLVRVLSQSMFFLTMFTLFFLGLALAYSTKPRKVTNVKWLPFIYVYWSLQIFVAFYAFLQLVFCRPRKWGKVERTGSVTEEQPRNFCLLAHKT